MSVSATAYQYLVNVSNCYLYLLQCLYLLPVSGLISLSATCICCNVSIYYLYLLQCLYLLPVSAAMSLPPQSAPLLPGPHSGLWSAAHSQSGSPRWQTRSKILLNHTTFFVGKLRVKESRLNLKIPDNKVLVQPDQNPLYRYCLKNMMFLTQKYKAIKI